MNTTPATPQPIPSLVPTWGWFVIGFAMVQLMVLHATTVPLSPRELTYWAWGQNFSLNYGGHGPLLPWLIGISTFVLGDTEFAVRVWGPVLSAVGLLFGGAAISKLYGEREAAVTGITTLLIPIITVTSLNASIGPPLVFACGMALWSSVSYLFRPAFRHMLLAGLATSLAILIHPLMVGLPAGLLIGWVSYPAMRAVINRDAILVFLVAALLIPLGVYPLEFETFIIRTHQSAGMLSALDIWLIFPFVFASLLALYFVLFSQNKRGHLIAWSAGFLVMMMAVGPAGAAAPFFLLFLCLGAMSHDGDKLLTAPLRLIGSTFHLVLLGLAVTLMLNPGIDERATQFIKTNIEDRIFKYSDREETFLYQHYRARSLARLVTTEWQDGGYSGIATDIPNLIPGLKFYGPSPAPLYWLGQNIEVAAMKQTQLLPLVAGKPILIITENETLLNDQRLVNPVEHSRTVDPATKDMAEKTWIVFSAYLKVTAE